MSHPKKHYYSTNTRLAYNITKKYFGGKFRIYCCDEFRSENPRSSDPANLFIYYQTYVEEGGDQGDLKVSKLKEKLKAAGRKILGRGTREFKNLTVEINRAKTYDFAPVIYVILKSEIFPPTTIDEVPLEERASSNSREWIITDLQIDQFEVLYTNVTHKKSLT